MLLIVWPSLGSIAVMKGVPLASAGDWFWTGMLGRVSARAFVGSSWLIGVAVRAASVQLPAVSQTSVREIPARLGRFLMSLRLLPLVTGAPLSMMSVTRRPPKPLPVLIAVMVVVPVTWKVSIPSGRESVPAEAMVLLASVFCAAQELVLVAPLVKLTGVPELRMALVPTAMFWALPATRIPWVVAPLMVLLEMVPVSVCAAPPGEPSSALMPLLPQVVMVLPEHDHCLIR